MKPYLVTYTTVVTVREYAESEDSAARRILAGIDPRDVIKQTEPQVLDVTEDTDVRR